MGMWKLNKGQNMQHVQKKSETNLECNELSLRSQSAASSSQKEMALFSSLKHSHSHHSRSIGKLHIMATSREHKSTLLLKTSQ